jgi:hypothetical protein
LLALAFLLSGSLSALADRLPEFAGRARFAASSIELQETDACAELVGPVLSDLFCPFS